MQQFMCYCKVFALFYFEFEGNFRVQLSRHAWACIWRGDLSELRVFYVSWRAYTWRGLFYSAFTIWVFFAYKEYFSLNPLAVRINEGFFSLRPSIINVHDNFIQKCFDIKLKETYLQHMLLGSTSVENTPRICSFCVEITFTIALVESIPGKSWAVIRSNTFIKLSLPDL